MALPASVVSTDPNLLHLSNVVYFERKMVENLKAHLPFYLACENRPLPERSGKTIQLFSRVPFTYNTTPASEGTPGIGISYSTVRVQATLAEFADYITFSKFILETSIADELQDEAKELGYRASLTVNRLVQVQFDSTADSDATTNVDLTAGSEVMTAATSRRMTMSLQGANVRPKSNGFYFGIIHPFQAYDFANDNTAGGLLDIDKRSREPWIERGFQGYRFVRHMGIDWVLTSTVGTTANYQSGGNTGYHNYVLGEDAFICVSLGGKKPPSDEKNFQVMLKRYDEPTKDDPAGMIGGSVGYRFLFAITPPPGQPTTIVNRFRRGRAEVSIS